MQVERIQFGVETIEESQLLDEIIKLSLLDGSSQAYKVVPDGAQFILTRNSLKAQVAQASM